MTLLHVAILLGTGVVVGFAGGLLGLGGGFVMGPVQYFVFLDMGMEADAAIKMAFGTNLLVALLTSLSGAWRHSKKGAVNWRAAAIMGVTGMFFAYGGATLTNYIPGAALRIAFGVLVLGAAVRMLVSLKGESQHPPVSNPWLWFAWAMPLGLVAGLLGLGGGLLGVPVMLLALRFPIHRAVATSLAMIIFNSIGGIVGYIINGLNVPNLPDFSLGYVNLASAGLLAVGSIGMVQVGAITAHKLSGRSLRLVFILLMVYIGLKMVGLFDWLGWPV